uniref:Uncharacterized protein n=1 Tax=Arundo donax TaxID=35708 RepID=A0A0A8XR08_ARUDO
MGVVLGRRKKEAGRWVGE